MLLCAIVCCVVVVSGFHSAILLILETLAILINFILMLIKKANASRIFAAALVFIVLINTYATLYNISKTEKLADSTCTAEFIVCETPFTSDGFDRATIEITRSSMLKKGDKLMLFAKSDTLSLGQHMRADLTLSKIENDFKNKNYADGIYLTANASNLKYIKGKTDFLLTFADDLRSYIRTTLYKYTDHESASTLSALIFGETEYFSNEFYLNVKRSGVSHVMVVSGMHLSIFVLLITYLTNKFIYNRHLSAIIMVLSVLFMTVLCGFTHSMLRAGITYLLCAIALIINRPSTPENTLGATFTIICITSPFTVFSVSFQLSLLSTFGIIVVAVNIIDYVKNNELIKNKFLFSLFSSACVTISAMVLTLPVAIYVFGFVSTVSVITNLLISPAVSIAIWLALFGLVVSAFPPVAEFVFYYCELVTKYINGTINFFGSLPFSAVSLPKYAIIPAIILIILIFWGLLACKVKQDMIKLEEMRAKIIEEGGRNLKWR